MPIYRCGTEFLAPYVEACKGLVPIDKLHSVKAYRVPLNRNELSDGSITKYSKDKYVIALRLQTYQLMQINDKTYKKTRLVQERLENILFSLSHELAHLRHWDHNPKHMALLGKLLTRMSRAAKEQGIKNTNESLKPKKDDPT